jgi:DNA modification methylase
MDRVGQNHYERSASIPYRDLCGKCGARRVDGQIGLEPTPDAFVAEMVRVFREVRRVLRDDGTLWLNLGSSYAGSGKGGNPDGSEWSGFVGNKARERTAKANGRVGLGDFKPKDLIPIPWMVAMALQQDGWWLRADLIWSKPNPMPESVADRPTKSHEYLFLLSKSERYFWDGEAVREKAEYGRRDWKDDHYKNGDIRIHHKGTTTGGDPEAGRNLRSVWTIPTESFIGAHFATFPRRLVEPCIRAGTSGRGACPACGAPWVRIRSLAGNMRLSRPSGIEGRRRHDSPEMMGLTDGTGNPSVIRSDQDPRLAPVLPLRRGRARPGHRPRHLRRIGDDAGRGRGAGPARRGVDLSRDYLTMAARRLSRPHARIPRPGRDEAFPLFERGVTSS